MSVWLKRPHGFFKDPLKNSMPPGKNLAILSSHFDESYALTGHNGKNHGLLPIGRAGKAKKLLFCSAIPEMCHFGPMHIEEGHPD